MLNSFISLIIVVLFAFSLYATFKLKSEITPLVSLTTIISFVTILSLVDMLYIGVVLAYIISILFFAYSIFKNKDDLPNTIKGFFSPSVILFLFTIVLMLLFLAYKQPLHQEWDEFSFWGTSQKLLTIHDQLYTYYPSSMIGVTTPPSLAVLSYFFQSFNAEYTEWISFFSYDVFFFSAFASFGAAFKRKDWKNQSLIYLLGFLIPYFFAVYTKAIYIAPMYISTYADIPLGIMFCGVLSVYLLTEEKNILPLVPMIFLYTLMKDMGFAFSFIAIFIIFFDLLVYKKEFKFLFFKGLLAKISAAVVLSATAVSAFLAWAIHMGAVREIDRFNLGGVSNIGMAEMLFVGVVELFSPNKSEKFIIIQDLMIDSFFKSKISMLGTGFLIVCIISAIFLFSILTTKKENKLRFITLYITSFIGFIGYYVFHIFLYVYIFKDNAYGLPSYNRYIYAYYIGWLMLSVFVFILSYKDTKGKLRLLKDSALFVSVLAIFILFSYLVSFENMFIGVQDRSYSLRYSIKAKVELIEDVVSDDDVIYCLSGVNDYGERWFIYTFEYAQNMVLGDLPYFESDLDINSEEYRSLYRQNAIEYLKENNATHLLIDHTSIISEYYLAEDFDEHTGKYGLTGIAYYEIEYIGDDDIHFHLLKGGYIS